MEPTYTILLRDFTAPVRLAGGAQATVRIELALTVPHPGPGFPDDISAVMSYEDIVVALRALCAETAAAEAAALAERAAAAALANPVVLKACATVALPGSEATIERTRT